ncbi:hypothetical protein VPHG_00127 [Vibrio phage 11895-B1]|uniref:hypothetical protein n=1 Tax=Vibrio phage 11895-B1 TaxID=754075 RepID=UPI0002C13375|nr:hypothetical protein VPHG_00127 [Vibrio phage 11895-B1]AGH32194.1 hypothetical protein VPHG_00127 [Vibrio phage 11895-B1]
MEVYQSHPYCSYTHRNLVSTFQILFKTRYCPIQVNGIRFTYIPVCFQTYLITEWKTVSKGKFPHTKLITCSQRFTWADVVNP